ncbi:SusC/RagA family TonB-linked outer membrane protein [Mariniflexile sp. AS56]|uniref:SusC/RagA family TonB-linked outer membrane protein n=1 Tax=Mariniflexile sp. AS56 TaxID=3063957 RepID=UPI0026EAAF77|nr:SusC/RagA family TonB-linked outer membrane protein [Mariniflexile sp. AS56]MDO7172351.1 SusC/RagA family TonB-linked outer membrane protein [Mariniflexile sp. AS56]
MKLTITELKIFIFCLLNAVVINIGVAQNTPLTNLAAQDSLQTTSKDEMLTTPFGVFNLSNSTGAVFRVSGDDLRKTPGDNLSEALRGRVPGLKIIRQTNTPGADGGYTYTLNGGTPYVLIDGQPRGLQVDLREVEEVLVLSDGTFNSLLGNLGDNGLIYVITKGGKIGKPTIEVNYQRGLNTTTRLPKLLSASEYATVINQAASNDGLGAIYSPEAIAAYSNGSDPINFPNVNRQDTFLEDSSPSNFASFNFYGGEENVSYSAFLGYSDWKGIEKIGDPIKGRNLTFRTKINTKINNLLTTHASVYGKFGEDDRPVLNADAMFNWITSTPANAFPLKVGDSAYVVSNQFNTNLLSELENGGTRTDYTANMVFDLGLDFDFKDYVPGLKYSTYVMMRTYNAHSLITNNTPALYTLENLQDEAGLDSLALNLYKQESIDLNVGRSNAAIQRNFAYGGNFNYFKDMNDASLNLNFSHLLYYQPNRESTQPDKRNLTFNLNGSFALLDKYVVYANLNSSSSSKFIGHNRTNLFPTLGFSWIASNENFLKDSKTVDYLKFRTSFGQVGTEYTASTFYYLDTWGGGRNNGTIFLGTGNNSQDEFGYRQATTGNEDIDWVVYNQMFAGFELSMFKKLKLDINYFSIDIQDQLTKASQLYASALGDDVYLPQLNFTQRSNKGFNSNITFSDSFDTFKYYVSVNAGYNKITGEKIAEVPYPDQYRLQQGQAEDNIIGYVSDGLFTADNIGSALPQFGDVKVGDVRYVDQNGDNVIDVRDQRAIGNNTPRFNYGINVGVAFKGFNLDVVGMGVSGYDINLNNYAYFKHGGLGNYFGSVNSDLPNGNANPRLSTISSINNYKNSDYWLVDGSFFRISNLELGYTLPQSIIGNGPFADVKLFLRGSNLALFSKMNDLDPEDPRSGIYEYPMMRTFVLGASLDF